jgi:ribosomal protein L11 methylase PrmA
MLATRLPEQVEALIVSGLLQEEGDQVATRLVDRGLRVQERRDAGEWTALLLG